MTSASVPSVRFVSWAGHSGLAIAAKGLIRALDAVGVVVQWDPIIPKDAIRLHSPGSRESFAFEDARLEELASQRTTPNIEVLCVTPNLFPSIRPLDPRAPRAAYVLWETTRLPEPWVASLNEVDLVLTATDWGAEAFRASGVRSPIRVVPLALDHDLGNAAKAEIPGIASDSYVFYSIGHWTTRKALDLTVEAFWRTFSASDPVVLLLKTSAEDLTRYSSRRFESRLRAAWFTSRRAVRSLRRGRKGLGRVILVTEDLSPGEMASLHVRGDGYVSLSRGEGWGLGAFHAAAAGNPVVITDFAAPREYLPADAAYFVDCELTEVRPGPYERIYDSGSGQRWAEPSVASASALLRQVYERREESAARGRRLQEHIYESFSLATVGATLLESLEEALDR